MLPEVGIDDWRTDGDLFATGIVLYELVTGHHPYSDRKPNAEEQPADPRVYNPELSPTLQSCFGGLYLVIPMFDIKALENLSRICWL